MFGKKLTKDEKAILARRTALIAQMGRIATELDSVDFSNGVPAKHEAAVSVYLAAAEELRDQHGYNAVRQFDIRLNRAINGAPARPRLSRS